MRIEDFRYSPYDCATVKNIEKMDGYNRIHLFRSYTHTANFTYIDGVLCYVGVEIYHVHSDSSFKVLLLEETSIPEVKR